MEIDYDELKLVLNVIKSKTGKTSSFEVKFKDCDGQISDEKIYFYIELLEDDGLVEVQDRIEQTQDIIIKRMTMNGFRTLGAMNSDNIWSKIKTGVKDLGISGLKQIPSLTIKLLSES